VPGFAVFFQAHLFGLAVRVEAEHGLGGADFYGDDVPDVQRDHVGGDEIDVALGVDGAAFADGVGGAGFVGAGAEDVGALDLDAEEVDDRLGAVVEDEIVALAVSPGLADGEAALAGAVEEDGFGELSGALGVGAVGVAGLVGLGTALRHRNSWEGSSAKRRSYGYRPARFSFVVEYIPKLYCNIGSQVGFAGETGRNESSLIQSEAAMSCGPRTSGAEAHGLRDALRRA
jgi:hypothetical protein